MSLSEFDIIQRYFNKTQSHSSPKNKAGEVLLGSGDDGALIPGPGSNAYAMSVDNLVQGQHFFKETPPGDLGHKALAVALSDLTAMGARPNYALLCLTLPEADPKWLDAFSHDFYALAGKYQVSLIGGNIAAGPLNISTTVVGTVPAAGALTRSGARVGDIIYIIGELGGAAAALASLQRHITLTSSEQNQLMPAWSRPEPLCPICPLLLDYAHCAIDISDGLLADLQHILTASGNLGATLQSQQLPIPPILKQACTGEQALTFALTGGEDYALCITVSASRQKEWEQKAALCGYPISAIGHITDDQSIKILDPQGQAITPKKQGWMHFN